MNEDIRWEMIAEVFNQDEAQLITGLFSVAGIQSRLEWETAGEVYGLTVGPLARIRIYVPKHQVNDAEKVLVGDFEDPFFQD